MFYAHEFKNVFSKISIQASSTHCKDHGELCLANIVEYVLSKLTNRIVSCSPLKVCHIAVFLSIELKFFSD